MLEFGYDLESVEIYNDKNMIFTVSSAGLVSAYLCDLVEMNVTPLFKIEIQAYHHGQG